MKTAFQPEIPARHDGRVWPVLQPAVESFPPEPPPLSFWRRQARRLHPAFGKSPALPPGVYILLYHSVVEPEALQEWERYYRKGSVTAARFATQMDILAESMTPLPLSEVPGLWARGDGPRRPCFVVTFDDGFVNNLAVAHPLLRARGIRPTVFVNAAFAQGGVLYRVLAAILTGTGLSGQLAAALRRALPGPPWSDDPQELFNQTKEFYQANVMERTIERVYAECRGDPADLRAHMNVEQIRQLQQEGWEIANHTYTHSVLSSLNHQEVVRTVERNGAFWRQQGIELIPFLGYPYGLARDVHRGVHDYLLSNPHLHGIFAGGGVNLIGNRTEWLRFSLGAAQTRQAISDRLRGELARTGKALAQLMNEPSK
ncbi:MAG: polysaccharide deacetylase family protein [Magnetococcales bacterium]|nr:polysaccharide deacetylase family protein [Magnetococcales bacterium]